MKILDIPKALPSRLFPNKPGEYTWEDWEHDTRRAHPIRFFLGYTIPGFWRSVVHWLVEAYWAVAHRVWRRYHVMRLSNPGGGVEYNVGWIDVDTKLLICCGRVITDFIERERPCLDPCEAARPDDAAVYRALYHWWTVERPRAMLELRLTLRDRGNWRRYQELEKALFECDTEMMTLLIRHRGSMWT